MKENPGKCQESRVSAYATIKAAVKNHEKRTIVLHSFVIALLPFFNPTREQKTKYETHRFALAGDVKEYLAVYDVNKMSSALAYYAQASGFQFRVEPHCGARFKCLPKEGWQ